MYYQDKLESISEIFRGREITLNEGEVVVDSCRYPIVDDVIIALNPAKYPESLKRRLGISTTFEVSDARSFDADIQYTFGAEWQKFNSVLPEHSREFEQYFDLVDVSALKNQRVCDLGCGIGRWSYFLRDRVKELVLVDFSEAIFEARRNLGDRNNVLFVMADIKDLPFRSDFADLVFCLGVLHHLPTNALDEVRALKQYAPMVLIYLYYGLDNRPIYFQWLLACATRLRYGLAKLKARHARGVLTDLLTWTVYVPMVALGRAVKPLGLQSYVPLYDGYHDKTIKRVRQDVYDRFFTTIEQRFSKKEIVQLKDTYASVEISGQLPYWHFLCRRK